MNDPYLDREQTKAKHFILKNYLQALAFKIISFANVAYVDGFSGPWESKTEGFSDSSFMIAISVLLDAQKKHLERTGQTRKVRCFFSEKNTIAFEQLEAAVQVFNNPALGFEIKTYNGKFEDAVDEIQSYIQGYFPLIFIDPTGWSGYPFDKIKKLFQGRKCEVLINFMFAFINRFAHSDDREIVASLAPILGGDDWQERLDEQLSRGLAVEKLFRETLKREGNFSYVVSTKIDKASVDRPYFFLAYGTKSRDGLIQFRQTEYDALRAHAKEIGNAKDRMREHKTGSLELFAGHEAVVREATIENLIAEEKESAKTLILKLLGEASELKFSSIVNKVLEAHILRETNVKDICVDLARSGLIENTWGQGTRKPRDENVIKIRSH